jgi:uncharacterized protein (DUF433 family)
MPASRPDRGPGSGYYSAGSDYRFAFQTPSRHTGVVVTDQPELVSADPRVLHGRAVIAGTRVPVSVILDCLAAGMTTEEITTEYPGVDAAGVHAAAAYGRLT